jgi:hypothetical protein
MTLTAHNLRQALGPLFALRFAPDFDRDVTTGWLVALTRANVEPEELPDAVADLLQRAKEFPAPADLLERVHARRQAAFLAQQASETLERLRERREPFQELPAAAPAEDAVAPLEGLEVPPPREPLRAETMQRRGLFGPVRLPDGRLDPRWPEVKGREPAWRRKMLYDHGIVTYRSATAPNVRDARLEDLLTGKVAR